jgi:hypothetical protein
LLYIINIQSARAEIIEHRDGPYRGRAFNLNRTTPREGRK